MDASFSERMQSARDRTPRRAPTRRTPREYDGRHEAAYYAGMRAAEEALDAAEAPVLSGPELDAARLENALLRAKALGLRIKAAGGATPTLTQLATWAAAVIAVAHGSGAPF